MLTAEEQGDAHSGSEPSRFDQLIREICIHLLQLIVLDGMGAMGTVNEISTCSCIKCVVGLSLCGTKFSLMVSKFTYGRPQ